MKPSLQRLGSQALAARSSLSLVSTEVGPTLVMPLLRHFHLFGSLRSSCAPLHLLCCALRRSEAYGAENNLSIEGLVLAMQAQTLAQKFERYDAKEREADPTPSPQQSVQTTIRKVPLS
jgi:hypothetical protein